MNLSVGWVEGRNPTTKNFVVVGFHFVLPNLHLFLSFQSDKKGLLTIVAPAVLV